MLDHEAFRAEGGIRVGFQPVQPDVWPPSLWIAIPGKRAVPYRYWAWVIDPEQPYVLKLRIQADGPAHAAYIHTLVVEQWDGPPAGPDVTTSRLRAVNLRHYLRIAIDHAAQPIASAEQETGVSGTFWVETADGRIGPFGGPKVIRTTGRRRAQADRDRLDVVAEAYKAAKAAGQPVRESVMRACHVQSSQAARLIRAAREAGKLPPQQQRRR